jgi:hypothetical protein
MKGTILAAGVLLVLVGLARVETQSQTGNARAPQSASGAQGTVDRYCATCHNPRMKTGGLVLDGRAVADAAGEPQTWEKVVRKYAPA